MVNGHISLNRGMISITLRASNVQIPYEVHAEAKEKVEHRAHNTTDSM